MTFLLIELPVKYFIHCIHLLSVVWFSVHIFQEVDALLYASGGVSSSVCIFRRPVSVRASFEFRSDGIFVHLGNVDGV